MTNEHDPHIFLHHGNEHHDHGVFHHGNNIIVDSHRNKSIDISNNNESTNSDDGIYNDKSDFFIKNYNIVRIDTKKLLENIVPNLNKAQNKATFGMIISWIFLFPTLFLSLFIFSRMLAKYTYILMLKDIVEGIQLNDNIKINELQLYKMIGEDSTIAVIKKLIETGNLLGYRMEELQILKNENLNK